MSEPKLPPLRATTLPLLADARGISGTEAMRLHLLRIAADTAPRLTGGTRIEDVVERARVLELYVTSPPLGSAAGVQHSEPETALPERGTDAGPADLRTARAEIGGERA
jgi:hypothetical protein